jgi:uncharacterized protein (DUF342 family)
MSSIFENDNQTLLLEIPDDHMSAMLTIHPGNGMINEHDIMDLIRKAGVTNGFLEATTSLLRNNYKKKYDEPFSIALCRYETKEPEITLLFDQNHTYNPSVPLSKKYTQAWSYVEKGSAIAKLVMDAEVGRIFNINGEPIDTAFNLENLIRTCEGENISYNPKSRQFIATQTGYPYKDENGLLNIAADFHIDEDIVRYYGDIALAGNLSIQGSVCEGCNISVLGDLFVSGNVIHSAIRANGSITVQGLIADCSDMGIIAQGDLNLHAAERSKLICLGTAHFEDSLENCRLIGEASIKGDPQESRIIGGLSQSAGSIDIGSAGSGVGIETELEVTISPYLKEQMINTMREIFRAKDRPEPDKALLDELNGKMQDLESRLDHEIDRILVGVDQDTLFIKIHKKLYPNTYLRILKKSYTAVEEKESFILAENEK